MARLNDQECDYFDILFDGPPSHESGRFVEVESPAGKGVRYGEWIDRGEGYWALRFPKATTASAANFIERTAQIAAHRACCGTEHDAANGKLHGYCVVCGVPWPCQYAGTPPPVVSSADTSTTPVCYVLMNAAGRMYWDEDSCVWSHPGDAEATLENEQDADPTAGWRVVPLHAGITQSASRACPYCTSDNEAIRSTYYDQTCAGCVNRMGQK